MNSNMLNLIGNSLRNFEKFSTKIKKKNPLNEDVVSMCVIKFYNFSPGLNFFFSCTREPDRKKMRSFVFTASHFYMYPVQHQARN